MFTPIVMAAFILHLPMLCVMCFTVGLMYWSLHEVAREIEEPFRYQPNDLPLRTIQRQFNERISVAYRMVVGGGAPRPAILSLALPAFEAGIRDDIAHAAADPLAFAEWMRSGCGGDAEGMRDRAENENGR